jgi:hypothetical protein
MPSGWETAYMNRDDIIRIAGPVCSKYGVKQLALFGSIARGDNASGSDVDLLVEFGDPQQSPAKRFFGLLHYLEDSLGCTVDLLTFAGLRNPYFRKRVEREKFVIYEG